MSNINMSNMKNLKRLSKCKELSQVFTFLKDFILRFLDKNNKVYFL